MSNDYVKFFTILTISIFATLVKMHTPSVTVYSLSSSHCSSDFRTILTNKIEKSILSHTEYTLVANHHLPIVNVPDKIHGTIPVKCNVHIDLICMCSLIKSETSSTLTLKLIDIPTNRVIHIVQHEYSCSDTELLQQIDTLIITTFSVVPTALTDLFPTLNTPRRHTLPEKEVKIPVQPTGDVDTDSVSKISDTIQVPHRAILQWHKITLVGSL